MVTVIDSNKHSRLHRYSASKVFCTGLSYYSSPIQIWNSIRIILLYLLDMKINLSAFIGESLTGIVLARNSQSPDLCPQEVQRYHVPGNLNLNWPKDPLNSTSLYYLIRLENTNLAGLIKFNEFKFACNACGGTI